MAKDKYATKAGAAARAKALGCSGTHSMDENGKTVYMPCSTHGAYQKAKGSGGSKSSGSTKSSGSSYESKANDKTAELFKEVNQALYTQVEGDEKALVDAMIGVVREYGKFGSEGSSVYVAYTPAAENKDAAIGVKCGNCVFHFDAEDGIGCSLIAEDIEENGNCRLAMIPPGLVSVGMPTVREAQSKYKVPEGVQSAAKRAQKWISEGKAGSGFTDVGRRRAGQLAAGDTVSRDTVARMKSYFARHNTDRKAEGFSSGEQGYPSPGRVAWDAWGGDAGRTWVTRINLDS